MKRLARWDRHTRWLRRLAFLCCLALAGIAGAEVRDWQRAEELRLFASRWNPPTRPLDLAEMARSCSYNFRTRCVECLHLDRRGRRVVSHEHC
jgi:hypothetical protein